MQYQQFRNMIISYTKYKRNKLQIIHTTSIMYILSGIIRTFLYNTNNSETIKTLWALDILYIESYVEYFDRAYYSFYVTSSRMLVPWLLLQ